jgi:NAD(P)-dependent dehydrogenase (short-subunit alcohol dehydrogenase family)
MSIFADPYRLFDVRGRVAIVAGATGSFGAVAAKTLAGAGCRLTLTAGTLDALSQVESDCVDLGAEVHAINARPETAEIADDIVSRTVDRFGGLDILVVAAGINRVNFIDEMEPDTFTGVMDVNVTQSWLMARAATRQMKQQGRGGRIVLVSSARGLLGHPAGYTAYCASKAAVDGIIRALGCELGGTGIVANALAPTVFRSPLTAWMFEDNDNAARVRTGFVARVPKGRLGEPEDLAGPLLFLASDACDFYTGHTLYADGGYTAG